MCPGPRTGTFYYFPISYKHDFLGLLNRARGLVRLNSVTNPSHLSILQTNVRNLFRDTCALDVVALESLSLRKLLAEAFIVLQIDLVIFEVPHAFHKGRRDHLPAFLQFLDLMDLHGNLRIKAPLCIIKLLELILEITVPSSRSKVLEPELL
jgi:hypothetical protein